MSEQKKNSLPRIEVVISGLFFLVFTVWAVGRCSATRKSFKQKEERRLMLQMEEDSIRRLLSEKRRQDSIAKLPAPLASASGEQALATSRLYVSVNGLKVRREPALNARVIAELKLFDELYFLGETTDFTQEINMGKAVVNEPWVRVQTREGRSGWVYGAGVHYYKRKHPAAE
jgi:hypothetical protein